MPARRPPVMPHDVQCLLLSYLGTPSLQRFARTNRTLYRHFKATEHHLYNVPAIISQFFEDVSGFREMQSNTGLLVSGSQALQLFARVRYAGSDMDLCVSQRFAAMALQWILDHGYQLLDLSRPNDGLDDVFTVPSLRHMAMRHAYNLRYGQLVFRFVGVDSPRRVDLIVSSGCALTSVLDFHSTAVMNFIAADYAISLFPHATFVQGLSLVLRSDDEYRTKKCVEKYDKRGFTPVYSSRASFAFAPGFRWIRDSISDAGLQLARGTRRNTAIRARACWILRLPKLSGKPQPRTVSRSSWFFGGFEDRSPGGGLEHWHRNGWRLVESAEGCEISIAGLICNRGAEYSVPPEFHRFVMNRLSELGIRESFGQDNRYDVWQRQFMLLNI